MSTNSATAATKPFLFDNDFDALAKAAKEATKELERAEAEEVEEEEFEEEIVPTFSEEELERAKQDAREAGKKEGHDEAMATIERETRDVIKALSLRLTDLFAAQERANSILMRDGIGIAVTMVRKLFPEMNRANSLGEIRRLIETTLMRLIEEPRIIVRVHPDLHKPLEALVPDLRAGAGYEGRLLLKDDSKLTYGDCRLEWGDGSAERAVDNLWQSIDQIIEANLGEPAERDEDSGVNIETGVTPRQAQETPEAPASDGGTPEDTGGSPQAAAEGAPDGAEAGGETADDQSTKNQTPEGQEG